jgi:N-acetyl-anhydromuramyl-L-alanine amidase AmpD
MARPLFDSDYLYGFHDPGGEDIMLGRGVPGWVVVTTAIGHNPADQSGQDFSQLSNQKLGVIVRLNNGYSSAGTLPYEKDYDAFAQRCANFVRASSGAHIWIIGNEPNHPIEWPGARWNWHTTPPRPIGPDTRGEPITPERYASAYRKARAAIHAVPGHEQDQVLVAAVAPWNTLTTYPGNEIGDWVQYFVDVLILIGPAHCDGITLHAYTHGTNPDFIESEERMRPPFDAHHWHFRIYQDFMNAVPLTMRHLPVYITETDQGDEPWHNANSGWVSRAYQEIDAWNQVHPQKIRALILYRWSKSDKWYIAGKQGVLDDFGQALARGYKWTVYDSLPDLGEYWRRLEELEAQKQAIQGDIDDALALGQELSQEMEVLKARGSELADVAALHRQLDALDQQVAALEDELDEIVPIIPMGAVARPVIHDIMADLPQHPSQRWPLRPAGDIRRIVVHHTGTDPDIDPAVLAQQAVDDNKPGMPYHFLITGDGSIYQTQPLTRIVQQNLSSGINRKINADSIAVALAGDFRQNRDVEPAEVQRQAAAALIAWLVGQQRLGVILTQIVFGRKELGENVVSPGDQWLQGIRWKDKLLTDTQNILDASQCGDPEEIARLRQQVVELQAEVARLQTLADQIGPLQKQISDLQATVKQKDQEITTLQAVIDHCAGSGAVRPRIIDVVDDLPRHPTLPPYTNRTEPIRKIVIHHTDTPKNMTVEQIANYHVFGTSPYKDPWPGIGYHYVIAPDGTIYWTQRHETRSYHVGAANNTCLGVSLIGRFMIKNYDGTVQPPEDQLPTPAQMDAAARLVAWLMDAVSVPDIENVVGHKEVGITACPGDQWLQGVRWKDALHARILSYRTSKPVELYLLFWDHGDAWARTDWHNAQNYIAHFRPTTGFTTADAMLARHVVIVGGPAGVSGEDEARLRAAGCDVHRLSGANEAETKAMLDELVAQNTPWPGADPVSRKPDHGLLDPAQLPPPEPDPWTIPDRFAEVSHIATPTGEYRRVYADTLLFPHQSD